MNRISRFASCVFLSLLVFCAGATRIGVADSGISPSELRTCNHWCEAMKADLNGQRSPVKVYLSDQSVRSDKPEIEKTLHRVRATFDRIWLSFDNDQPESFAWLPMDCVVAFHIKETLRYAALTPLQEDQQSNEGQRMGSQLFGADKYDVYLSPESVGSHSPALPGVIPSGPIQFADTWFVQYRTADKKTVWVVNASKIVCVTVHPQK